MSATDEVDIGELQNSELKVLTSQRDLYQRMRTYYYSLTMPLFFVGYHYLMRQAAFDQIWSLRWPRREHFMMPTNMDRRVVVRGLSDVIQQAKSLATL